MDEWRLHLGKVLADEHKAIWGEYPCPPGEVAQATEAQYRASVHRREQSALCLSGGGIRSAAFALGVLQGLALRDRLAGFHYLSTVSGGGYIGGWLTRWITQAGSIADVQAALKKSVPLDRQTGSPAGGFREPSQLAELRERSNFLTPRVGLASADTWTAATIVIRNLLLNWLLFGPALLLVALIFNLYRDLFAFVGNVGNLTLSCLLVALFTGALGLAVTNACHFLPTHALLRKAAAASAPDGAPPGQTAYAAPESIRRWIVTPALIWSALLPLALAPLLKPGATPGMAALAAAGGSGLAALGGYLIAWGTATKTEYPHFRANVFVWTFAAAIASAALAAGVWLAGALTHPGWRCGLILALGPLWVTAAQLMHSVVYAGFRQMPPDLIKKPTPDLDREWLARLSAAKLQPAFAWALAGFACLVLPPLVLDKDSFDGLRAWIVAAVGSISGVLAVFGGWSSLSKFLPGAGRATDGRAAAWQPSFASIVAVATIIFISMLLMLFAYAEDALLRAMKGLPGSSWVLPLPGTLLRVLAHATLAALLVVVLFVTSRTLQVNRFSLHALYRNRLVRAFLGAACSSATPGKRDGPPPPARDSFTDLGASDNMRVARPLRCGEAPRRLFHVINLALNVTGGERLAWQERKAISFTVTPLACGWTDPVAGTGQAPMGAYIDTERYAGKEPDLGMEGTGISLGTAMTISGAAVSPNMGYHSSPATAFLLTLFNVRLGAWLPNPAAESANESLVRRSSPRYALGPLLNELRGAADARRPFIYLSDGGHFENLGLYEMVRRRCSRILVSDAGYDPDCRFDDLGMAVRKIWIDQGIRIEIAMTGFLPRAKDGPASATWAIGTIRYPEAGAREGKLLYIKPSYHADSAPIDVRAYAEAEQSFPHQSTGDQWFSESQFESYRHLGEATLAGLWKTMKGTDEQAKALRCFFREPAPPG